MTNLITSLDFNEQSWNYKPYLPKSGTWIGEKCACSCHRYRDYWGKNKSPQYCCGTLHRGDED